MDLRPVKSINQSIIIIIKKKFSKVTKIFSEIVLSDKIYIYFKGVKFPGFHPFSRKSAKTLNHNYPFENFGKNVLFEYEISNWHRIGIELLLFIVNPRKIWINTIREIESSSKNVNFAEEAICKIKFYPFKVCFIRWSQIIQFLKDLIRNSLSKCPKMFRAGQWIIEVVCFYLVMHNCQNLKNI